MQLIQLRYFCTVARCQNMSRAADELWVSQPALSRAITTLEDELGVKLFERVGRNILLNDAGKLYYHQVSHILQLLNDANRQVQDMDRGGRNEIRVLFSAANFICAWFWENFEQRFPDVNLMVRDCYAPSPFDQMECDFHIFATPAVHDELEAIPLLEEELMLAMSRRHPLAARECISLEETRAYRFQTLPIHENLYDNLVAACQQLWMEPNVGFCTEDSFTFFNTLANSSFLALVPARTAFPALNNELVLRPIREPEVRRTISLGWSRERYLTEQGRKFIAYCKELFSRLADNGETGPEISEK